MNELEGTLAKQKITPCNPFVLSFLFKILNTNRNSKQSQCDRIQVTRVPLFHLYGHMSPWLISNLLGFGGFLIKEKIDLQCK